MSPEQQPTPAEWKILRIVSEHGPCAAREVVAVAEQAHGWSTSTIKTLLRRLVDKRHLKTKQVGNSFLYRVSRSASRSLREAADQLLDHAASGTVAPLLAYLVKKSKLSEEELQELRDLIDDKEAE